MLSRLFTWLCRRSPKLKRVLWKQWYQALARIYQRSDWRYMNYGYAPLEEGEPVRLDDADEDDRYCIQLYHHVASAVDLAGRDVLEVGSGRGGGSCYIRRCLEPRRMVGADFSPNAVAFCRRTYSLDGLTFIEGNAEALPFDDGSFDAVVNVESSHCYGSMAAFLAQVRRVLRDGGHFLYADFRDEGKIDELTGQLRGSGMTVVKEKDITSNIVRALDLDDERKIARIRKLVHGPLVRAFLQFAGTRGSDIYEEFRTRRTVYVSFVLRKEAS